MPIVFLLLSACSPQAEIPDALTQVPADIPAATATSAPSDAHLPIPTESPTDTPEPTEIEPTEVQPTEVEERPDITIALPEGDTERGKKLALKWRCFSCHVTYESGPRFGAEQGLPAMLERSEMRIADAAYTGFATTPEEYIIEAIIDPSVYVSEGEWEFAMDDTYDEDLSEKDLADVIALILTIE